MGEKSEGGTQKGAAQYVRGIMHPRINTGKPHHRGQGINDIAVRRKIYGQNHRQGETRGGVPRREGIILQQFSPEGLYFGQHHIWPFAVNDFFKKLDDALAACYGYEGFCSRQFGFPLAESVHQKAKKRGKGRSAQVRDARHYKVEEPAPQPLIEIYKYSCIFVVKKIPKSLQKKSPSAS